MLWDIIFLFKRSCSYIHDIYFVRIIFFHHYHYFLQVKISLIFILETSGALVWCLVSETRERKLSFPTTYFPLWSGWLLFKFQHSLAKIAFNFHVGQDLNCWQSGKNSRVSSWWFDIRLVTTVLFVCFFSKWGQTHWQLTYKVRHFCLTI